MKKVIIIGGGYAGLLTAIFIRKETSLCDITILERLPRIGKKILATGNGKCNFSNQDLDPSFYNHPEFVSPLISEFGTNEICDFYRSLGIMTKEISQGRMYPYNEKASTIVNALLDYIQNHNIKIELDSCVKKISYQDGIYKIYTTDNKYSADYCVLACGGKVNKTFGCDGLMLDILNNLGVTTTSLYPGLVGLKTSDSSYKAFDGLRVKALVSLYKDNNKIHQEEGEIQFKKDGVSGIVIMNIASIMNRCPGSYHLEFDFVPEMIENKLYDFVRLSPVGLEGVLPKALALDITKKSPSIKEAVKCVKTYKFIPSGDYGFDNAQVTIGGIKTTELDENLEIKKYPNLYAAGEIIDCDGVCGGYNLAFAAASGHKVAESIVGKVKC